MPPQKLLYVCNTAGIAARFRLPVLKGALQAGYEVECICGDGIDSAAAFDKLQSIGVTVHRLPGLEANGLSIAPLISQARMISTVLDATKPQIVHSFTHRANIASFLALRNRLDIRFIPNVTGAGRLFSEKLSPKDKIAKFALLKLYRAMAERCECIFFQNATDLHQIGGAMLVPEEKLRLTGGSGFDPTEIAFDLTHERATYRNQLSREYGIAVDKRIFLFPARALKAKGVQEFYHAAARYLESFNDAVFIHAGEACEAPHGLTRHELKALERKGLIYIGFQRDILRLMNAADIVVLPSAYREGVPRSLIEALYFGKIILTTDSAGCRETVSPGINGVLLEPASTSALFEAFVDSRQISAEIASSCGKALFERRFHASAVVSAYLEQYRLGASVIGPSEL